MRPPAMNPSKTKIAVAGAGSIGCYVGGTLAREGRAVTLLTRPRLATAITQRGLHVSDIDGHDAVVSIGSIRVTSDPTAAFADAELILVTVKSGDTAEMAKLLAAHAPARCTVVSLQNGVRNAQILGAALGPGRAVVPAMVPFNVVHREEPNAAPHFHRSTRGAIEIGAGGPELCTLLDVPGLVVRENPHIAAVLWSKLLVNLNNAPNALAGLSIIETINDRGWRRIFAEQMAEALRVYRAAGIKPAKIAGLNPALVPWVLRLPDFLFSRIAHRMGSIDPRARTSMLEDLERRRPTEIDYLHGEIAALGRKFGMATPMIDEMIRRVKAAEAAGQGSPHLRAADIGAR
jgi:2-dehydropantoate 2-reductase